jgi:hypothetical protein
MRRRAAFLLSAVALTALAACGKKPEREAAPSAQAPGAQAPATAAVPAMTPPKRKPGLWEQTISMSEMTQKSSICIDEAVENAMGWWGQQTTKDMCAKQSVTRALDGSWHVESECSMGSGGTTVTKGVASGDFNSSYKMEAETVTSGAAAPQMNGSHKMTLTAAWQGPCPPGMKPGDMQLPGGMKINMLELAKASKK